jgi:2-polyprenyl-3-methyl-5-hydroxy-6-metoxy-1,4-benzoquinol methylase
MKNLDTLIRTKIKDKKLHEIERIYELIKVLLEYSRKKGRSLATIVDVGSGLGHLTRILSTQLDCQVKTIEGNDRVSMFVISGIIQSF